jgi:GDP-mannose 6-dehydrogenase
MKIAIFGMGYVGTVTGACLAKNGNSVSIIEENSTKIDSFQKGVSPFFEPGLERLILGEVESGRLKANSDPAVGLIDCQFILICVGTPTDFETGKSNLSSLKAVAADIASHLKTNDGSVSIAVCSTVPPGTTEEIFRKILDEKGVPQSKYSLGFIPEFLREGSAISDFLNPTRFIIGSRNKEEAQAFLGLRPELSQVTHIVNTPTAEMLKTVENAWHATKITFANEVSRVCKSYDIDAVQLMEILIKDNKQNISSAYLRPGFAFGGSCLPKDLRSLNILAVQENIHVPMLSSIAESNREHVLAAISQIEDLREKEITVLGLAFKGNTDDIRESPALDLIFALHSMGFKLKVHDFNIDPLKLTGANAHIWKDHSFLETVFESDLKKAMVGSKVIVIAQYEKKYSDLEVYLDPKARILNLVGL